jgi:predicted DNA-binding transcriptional regulator AlpA
MEKEKINKVLLNLNEFCEYLGIGKTKARELLRDPRTPYSIRIGNRLYANKKKLEIWIEMQSGN